MIFIYKIDYEKIRENISLLDDSDYIILKSNAYGFGFKEILEIAIEMGNYKFAVIDMEYAIYIKSKYPDAIVLLLEPVRNKDLKLCEKHKIEVSINSLDDIDLLAGYKLNVQIEVNCGMNRFGIRPYDIERAINIINDNNLNLTGIYSHNATNDYSLTKNQLEAFYYAVKHHNNIDIHFAASSLMKKEINFQTARRIGAFIYDDALTVYGKIIQINEVYKGESIGYDFAYQFKDNAYVGVIDIGYADGLARHCDGFLVWVKDRYYPLIGKACMNYSFVLLDSVNLMDEEVVIIGKNNNIKKYEIYFDKIPHQIFIDFLKT